MKNLPKKNARAVDITDFWPPYQASLDDFYPGGWKAELPRGEFQDMRPIPEVLAISQKISDGLAAQHEMLMLVYFCLKALKTVGINI